MSKTTSTFTAEQAQHISKVYMACVDQSDDERREVIATLADELGKSTRQIIGKLSTMPSVQYRPYEAKKPAAPRVTNQMIVNEIAAAIGADKGALDSLSRGSKAALVVVQAFINQESKEA